jgi:glutamate 5-kinase
VASETEVRTAIADAPRIVVKIGSSSLTNAGAGLNEDAIADFAAAIARRRARGHQVIVVSSGAIAAGFPLLGLKKRPTDLATQQAAASIGQGMLLAAYSAAFATFDITVGQVLLTAEDLIRRSHYRNAQRTLFRLLELGVLPIVNENDTVATEEIRVGDNDRLAALVAHVSHAQGLVLLSDVAGLHDSPPNRADSTLIPNVVSAADLAQVRIGGTGTAGVGLGGMASKVDAAHIATGAGIPVLFAAAGDATTALSTSEVGTVFHPTDERPATRQLWLAHAASARGQLVLDDGAVRAITQRGASLLPAGITRVTGTFLAGDPVDLTDANGTIVARGLVNFDSAELPPLLGRSTKDLARELGAEYEREIVHRDDLAVLIDSTGVG